MKLLVVDNEHSIRKGLVELVQLFCPEVEEIKEADSVFSAREMLARFTPDLLLLDVELGDGTGMDLLAQLPEQNFQVIFITAHDKYALDAFRHSAIDFLLKPIEPTALTHAFEKAKSNLSNKMLRSQIEVFKEYLNASFSPESKVVLKDNQSIYFVKINDILHCQAENSYTIFHLVEGEQIVISKKIKEFEELLEPYGFIRVHQSHLVNRFKIKRFDKQDGGSLILEDNQSIPVAQRKRDYVLTLLSK